MPCVRQPASTAGQNERRCAMKKVILCLFLVLSSLSVTAQQAQQTINWDSLKFLMGNWVGEGSQETGQGGSGYCSFEPDLQGKVLLRKNHAEYPPTGDRPAI